MAIAPIRTVPQLRAVPRSRSLLLLLAAAAGCAHGGRGDGSAGAIALVRDAYGGEVRSQLPAVPARLSLIPACRWDSDGAPDSGLLLVIEDRRFGAGEGIVVARTVCRRARPGPNGSILASRVERFSLERRAGKWQVRERVMLEDSIR